MCIGIGISLAWYRGTWLLESQVWVVNMMGQCGGILGWTEPVPELLLSSDLQRILSSPPEQLLPQRDACAKEATSIQVKRVLPTGPLISSRVPGLKGAECLKAGSWNRRIGGSLISGGGMVLGAHQHPPPSLST